MKKLALIPWLIACLAPIGGVITGGGSVLYLLDIPSVLLVYGVMILLVLTHYSPSEIKSTFSAASGSKPAEKNEIMKAINCFKTMQKAASVSALIGTLLGAIIILRFISENTMKVGSGKIAWGVSAAVICIFYAGVGLHPIETAVVDLFILQEGPYALIDPRFCNPWISDHKCFLLGKTEDHMWQFDHSACAHDQSVAHLKVQCFSHVVISMTQRSCSFPGCALHGPFYATRVASA